MAGPGTHFSGPVTSGSKKDADANGAANTGLCVLAQSMTLGQNGAAAVTGSIVVPEDSIILGFNVDTTTAWNSGTSDNITIGKSVADATYFSASSVAAAGRITAPTAGWTSAELLAMADVGANTTVCATVTPGGAAATAGETIVTVVYVQTVQPTAGVA